MDELSLVQQIKASYGIFHNYNFDFVATELNRAYAKYKNKDSIIDLLVLPMQQMGLIMVDINYLECGIEIDLLFRAYFEMCSDIIDFLNGDKSNHYSIVLDKSICSAMPDITYIKVMGCIKFLYTIDLKIKRPVFHVLCIHIMILFVRLCNVLIDVSDDNKDRTIKHLNLLVQFIYTQEKLHKI